MRFFLCLLLLAPAALAQDGSVRGRVTDAQTGEGLPSASVALWRIARSADTTLATGAVTAADGRFALDGLRRGRYVARVSFVGFATLETPAFRITRGATDPDLGTLALEPAERLGEVDVVAERPRVQIGIDRTVYDVASDPVVQGGSATDALRTVPSVDVDVDGNVSLRGANVTILVDGRPAPVSSEFVAVYLESLPADAIQSVEVIPNPSAAFQAEGQGGMINLVLKQNTDLGLGGALTGGGDSQGGAQASALVAYGRGALSLTGTLGLRRSRRDADASRLRTLLGPGTTLDQATDDARTRGSVFTGLTAEYRAGPTTWGASGQLGLRDGREDETAVFVETDAAGDPLAEYTRIVDGTSSGASGGLRLTLRHDIAGVSQDAAPEPRRRGGRGGRGRGGRGSGPSAALGEHGVAVELRGSLASRDDDERVVQPGFDLSEFQLEFNDEAELSASVDYARPVGGLRLETGARSEIERSTTLAQSSRSAGGAVSDGERTFRLTDEVHAAYAQVQGERGAWGVQAGLRAEAARLDARFDDADVSPGLDVQLFPSASARWTVGDALALRAGYSRRIRRPRGRQLDPFPDLVDPLNVRVGNPDLRPEITDGGELSAIWLAPWGTLTATPYLRRTSSVIRRVVTLRADGVTESTFTNLSTRTAGGVEVVAAGVYGPLRGFASVEGYQETTDDGDASELAASGFGWGGRLNGTYAAGAPLGWGALDVQASLRVRGAQDTEQGRRGAIVFADLALRQEIGERAALTLRASDPFGWARIQAVTDTPQLYSEFERSFGRQQVALSLRWTFGDRDREPRRERPQRQGGEDFDDVDV